MCINVHQRSSPWKKRLLRVLRIPFAKLNPLPPLNKPFHKTTRESLFHSRRRETASLHQNNYYPGSIWLDRESVIPRGHIFPWGVAEGTVIYPCRSSPSYFPPRLSYLSPLSLSHLPLSLINPFRPGSADSRGGWPWLRGLVRESWIRGGSCECLASR